MTTAPFEIKVVYDASRRKRRGVVVRSSHARSASPAGTTLVVGALLNLAIAGAMYYATWWRADPFIYITFMKKMPLDMPSEFAANPFGIGTLPSQPAADEQPADSEQAPSQEAGATRWSGKTAQVLIPGAAYGWLILATAGACAVAMTGGAWLGAAGGHWARLMGGFGVLTLIAGVGYFGFRIWSQTQMMFKPDHLRVGMGLLALTFALYGLALAHHARGITKMAGALVIVAAIATAEGIWLWTQTGALDLQYASWSWLAAAFGIHAIWGVILIFLANRIRAWD